MTKEQWLKVLRGALVAVAGALVVYIPGAVSEIEFGAFTPLAVAVASILVNVLRVYSQK